MMDFPSPSHHHHHHHHLFMYNTFIIFMIIIALLWFYILDLSQYCTSIFFSVGHMLTLKNTFDSKLSNLFISSFMPLIQFLFEIQNHYLIIRVTLTFIYILFRIEYSVYRYIYMYMYQQAFKTGMLIYRPISGPKPIFTKYYIPPLQ